MEYLEIMYRSIIFIYIFHSSEGNHNLQKTVLCENTSLHISCNETSLIAIHDVRFGPSTNKHNACKEPIAKKLTSRLSVLCNERIYCQLNSIEDDLLEDFSNLERLLNITYECDYKNLGCNEGNVQHIIVNGTKEMHTTNMYDLTCRDVCHRRQPLYTNSSAADCINSRILNNNKWCKFSATVINTTPLGYQISRNCKEGKIKASYLKCSDGGICILRQYEPKDQFISKDVMSTFLKINYTCRALTNKEDEQSTTVKYRNSDKTGFNITGDQHDKYMLYGIFSVVCLVCGIITVIYIRKRRTPTQSVDSNMSPDFDQAVVEYSDLPENNHVLKAGTVVYQHDTRISRTEIKLKGQTLDIRQTGTRHSISEDVYADAVDGIYDITNKPRYKEKHQNEQYIYSHTMDDVYDITNQGGLKNDEVENIYD